GLVTRLPGRAGDHARARVPRRAREPPDRHRARSTRSPGDLRMSVLVGPAGTLLEALERRSRTSRLGRGRITLAVGILILGTMIVASLPAPLSTGATPDVIDPLHPLLHPLSPGHPLGTDSFGRDIFSRILYGGRGHLLFAFAPPSATAVAGT